MGKPYDVKVIRTQFDAALGRLKRYSFQGAKKLTTDAAEMFLQSATRATPPNKGNATIPKEMYERGVLEAGDMFEKGRHTHCLPIRIPYRQARRRGAFFFNTRAEAESSGKRRITYRGIGRAGWFLALLKIGRNLTVAHRKMLRMAPDIESKSPAGVRIVASGNDYVVELTNRSPGIDRYASLSVPEGLIKARNKLRAAAKVYALDLAKLFR
jgi:hypothetical protein